MNELSLFNSLFKNDLDFDLPDFFNKTSYAMPKVDVKETKESYVLDMDLPGRSEKDVELSVKDNVLTIASSHEEKKEEKSAGDKDNFEWLIRERHRTSFCRRFTLPQDIDVDNVKASFKDGVLQVTIPRKAVPQTKRITIATE